MGYHSLPWLQGASALAGTPASSDFLIDRIGRIFQITKPGQFAYHTGAARWRVLQDRDYTLNQSAVGIELEAAEQHRQTINDPQIIGLAALLRALLTYHQLDPERITTHSIVALPAGRKVDPVFLDWYQVMVEMAAPSAEAWRYQFPAVLP
jgi:N-acetyl-anhydromuramyl-L-alanine amidase AmpD